MLALFASAFFLGLIFNAAPGAVFAETVRQGARHGFRGALHVQLGSLLGDATWAVAGLLGVGLLLQVETLRLPVGVLGAAYLLWLSWDSWKSARSGADTVSAGSTTPPSGRALRAGMVLSMTNPQNVAYWAALGSALGAVGVHEPTTADYGIFFAGFIAASLVWAFVCAALVALVFKRIGGRWVCHTYRLAAVAFLVLACMAIGDLLRSGATRLISLTFIPGPTTKLCDRREPISEVSEPVTTLL